jgi:hypothetical protein
VLPLTFIVTSGIAVAQAQSSTSALVAKAIAVAMLAFSARCSGP